MDLNRNRILPETMRRETWFGTYSMDLFTKYPEAIHEDMKIKIEWQIEYDIKKIREYLLSNLKPMTYGDIPPELRSNMHFAPWAKKDDPFYIYGKRVYLAEGPMQNWEWELEHRKYMEKMKNGTDRSGQDSERDEGRISETQTGSSPE